jgi:hypothetical protein
MGNDPAFGKGGFMLRKPVLYALFAAILTLFFSVLSVSAQGPSISVDPASGEPGRSVNVSGSGFGLNVPCDLVFGSYGTLASFSTDGNGGVSTSFTVPGQASPGITSVQVNCPQVQQSATTSFTVVKPPPPTNPPPTNPPPVLPTKTCQQLQNCTPTPSPSPLGTETPTASPSQTPTPTPSTILTPTASLTATRVLPTAVAVATLYPSFIEKIISLVIPHPTPTPTPVTVDLELVKVEITQGIQCINNPACKDNSTPLFIGKPTMVRAYVRIKSGPSSVSGISAILCNQWYTSAPATCIRPISPITVYNIGDPVAIWRGDLRYTLNFILPPDWTSKPGWQNFLVQVNYKMENVKECPDWSCERNNMSYNSAFVETSRKLNIVFVQIQYKGVWSGDYPKWNIVDWLKRVYPTSEIGVWKLPVGIVTRANLSEASSSDKPCGGWSDLLDELSWLKDNTTGGGDKFFYGMVPSSTGTLFASGCGRYPDSPPVISAGTVGNPGRVDALFAAHELGHNMGRAHTPGCGAGRPDISYPEPLGNLDDTGIDILRSQVYKNNMSSDIMSYCGGEDSTWISSYTYRALIGTMGYPAIARQPGENVLASLRQVNTVDYLVGSGYISPTSVDIRHGFYRLSLVPDPAYRFAAGTYVAELQDASGMTLSTFTFLPAREDNVLSDSGSFHIRIPWVEETAAVVFKYNGMEIGRRQASAGVPVVTLLSPNGGETWGQTGAQTIAWTARDPDGDKLTYMVDYSQDNGATWQTLAANIVDTQLDLDDISSFPGGTAALIRVTATDGFNTAWDTSDSSFSVEVKGPSVHISSPTQGTTLTFGSPLILWGLGTDPQDGPLADTAFTWNSSRDGILGSSSLLLNQTLSVGEHTLTLTGTNSAGYTSSQSINILVTQAETPPAQPVINSGQHNPTGWLIIAVAILFAGSVVFLLLRNRRKRD